MIINPEAVFNVTGIEKSWDEFEKFTSKNEDKLKSIEKQVAWDIWVASRQALVVELPTINDVDFGDSNGSSAFDEGFDVGFADAVGEFKARLCKAGVSYK